MQNRLYGVSPAFFLSLYGQHFSPEEFVQGLDLLAELGFSCYQGEIVTADQLAPWLDGGALLVHHRAQQLGLTLSQFVAHFMLDAFCDRKAVCSDAGIAEIAQVTRICDLFGKNIQITVPMGRYQESRPDEDALISKLIRIAKIIADSGHRMALEIQPGAMVQGADAILACIGHVKYCTGYNFDTGHAWASGSKNVAEFPLILGSAIYGTHLCDNNGIVNDSLRPGKGTIAWERLIPNLVASGYSGSLDLEIICDARDVPAEYARGLAYMKTLQ